MHRSLILLRNRQIKLKNLTAGLFALVMGACGTTTPENLSDTYTLLAIGESPLPAPIDQSSSGSIEVLGGSLVLKGDGTFLKQVIIRQTQGNQPSTSTTESRGQYQRTRATLELRYTTNATETLAIEAGGATLRTTALTDPNPGLGHLVLYVYGR